MQISLRVCYVNRLHARRPTRVQRWPTSPGAPGQGMAHDRTRPDTGRVRRLPDGGDRRSVQFQFSVPGAVVPVAGVTLVSVLPTHRRRGILRSMMRRQLSDIAERGESLAALWASESMLYGRYGYGKACCASG